jgi:hypothetical protein
MLLSEDPDGEPLDRLVRRPMELKQFLRCAIGLAAALGQVHEPGSVWDAEQTDCLEIRCQRSGRGAPNAPKRRFEKSHVLATA